MADARDGWHHHSELERWKGNPRRNAAAVPRVMESIRRYGFVAPVVVWPSRRRIVAGDTRILATRALLDLDPAFVARGSPGPGMVKVTFHEFSSEREANAYGVADNRLNEIAEWDRDLLAQVELSPVEHSLLDVGDLLAPPEPELAPETPAEPGEAPEPEELPPARPRSKAGRIYELGPHLLTCGDSTRDSVTERALAGTKPRLALLDPPFDADYAAWKLPPSADVVAVWQRSKNALLWMARAFAGDEWGAHQLVFAGGARGQLNLTLPCCVHENITVWRRKWWERKGDAICRKSIRESGARRTVDGRPFSLQRGGGVVDAMRAGFGWAKPTLQSEILVAYVPRGSVVWDPDRRQWLITRRGGEAWEDLARGGDRSGDVRPRTPALDAMGPRERHRPGAGPTTGGSVIARAGKRGRSPPASRRARASASRRACAHRGVGPRKSAWGRPIA